MLDAAWARGRGDGRCWLAVLGTLYMYLPVYAKLKTLVLSEIESVRGCLDPRRDYAIMRLDVLSPPPFGPPSARRRRAHLHSSRASRAERDQGRGRRQRRHYTLRTTKRLAEEEEEEEEAGRVLGGSVDRRGAATHHEG